MIAYLVGGVWLLAGIFLHVRLLTLGLAMPDLVGSMHNMKIKTEHNGSKKGNGAFYGRKKDAKKLSNSARRQADKQATR
jgi:hypothetical protein